MTEEEISNQLDKAGIQALFEASPFISSLNLEVLAIDYESQEITVRMPQSATTGRRVGTKQFHGGPLAAFIDIVGDFAIGMMVGGGVPTMNLRIDYLGCASGPGSRPFARFKTEKTYHKTGLHESSGAEHTRKTIAEVRRR